MLQKGTIRPVTPSCSVAKAARKLDDGFEGRRGRGGIVEAARAQVDVVRGQKGVADVRRG